MQRGPYKGRNFKGAVTLKLQGYNYQEISDALDIPLKTVWNWTRGIEVSEEVIQAHKNQRLLDRSFPNSPSAIRERLILERGHQCEGCGLDSWREQPIVLEMHRIQQGGYYTRENTQLLCPNCHAQTPTWRKRGVGGKEDTIVLETIA